MQKIELKNKIGKTYFTVEHNEKSNWVYANWIGFVTVEEVIAGAEACLKAFELSKCPNFINDNRLLTGPWQKANDWIEQNWTPRALQLGLKNFAFITSPNIFGEMSAKALETRLDNIGFVMRNFKDYDEALRWMIGQIKKAKTVS